MSDEAMDMKESVNTTTKLRCLLRPTRWFNHDQTVRTDPLAEPDDSSLCCSCLLMELDCRDDFLLQMVHCMVHVIYWRHSPEKIRPLPLYTSQSSLNQETSARFLFVSTMLMHMLDL